MPDPECWSRALTNSDYITADKTVHISALKGRGGLSITERLPWSHELSGRLVSMVEDFATETAERIEAMKRRMVAEGKKVPSKIGYAGVAFARAVEMRSIAGLLADVIYTPNSADTAHSDVLIQHNEDDRDIARTLICGRLRVAHPPDVRVAVATCGSPNRD